MSANERQVGGRHYQEMDPQPWDVTIPWVEQGHIGHAEAVIIEYLARWRRKNGVGDLRKAAHWLQKLIERQDAGDDQAPVEPPEAAVRLAAQWADRRARVECLALVPGGDICDPQVVADSIRRTIPGGWDEDFPEAPPGACPASRQICPRASETEAGAAHAAVRDESATVGDSGAESVL